MTENIPSGKFPEAFRGIDLTFRAISLAGKETFLLGETSSSVTPNSFNGRFGFLSTPQKNSEKAQIKGLRYTPSDKKIRNVFNNWSYPSKVAINGMALPGDLPLNEMYVLVDKNSQFVLLDQVGKKFKVDQFCMANMQREDNLVRFMLDVSNPLAVVNKIGSIKNIIDDHSKRIVYNNIIISPEKWIIHCKNGKDKQALIDQLHNRKIPRQISLIDFYMIMPLDISKESDLDILQAYCNKHETVVLSENFCSGPGLGVLDKKKNVLATEYTFTYKRGTLSVSEVVQNEDMMLEHTSFRNRFTFYNGINGWLYINIYVMIGLQNFFITHEIKSLLNKEQIPKWFFIRHFDGRDHLRLRVAPQKEQNLINKLFIWLNNLLQEGDISDYSFIPYECDIERYGGEKNSNSIKKSLCSRFQSCFKDIGGKLA